MAVYIAASVEGLSRINLEQDGWKSWERTRLGKNVNKNVNKQRKTRDLLSSYEATAAHM